MYKLVVSLLLLAGHLSASTLEINIPLGDGEKFKSARFRSWLPEDVAQLRAILIHQHGCGRNGFDQSDDIQWRALANKHHAALLGTHFKQEKECSGWFNPANGSERALAAALLDFAERARHPELTTVPWALWGHSGGGLWAMGMANRHPDRVVAVFARSGTNPDVGDKVRGVPILLQYGEQEKTGRFANVHENAVEALARHRPHGAYWAPAIDPQSSHDCRQSRHLAIPFFDSLLAARLPDSGTTLKRIDPALAWLANLETLEIVPLEKYAGDKAKAGWLPNERVAKVWQEFYKTGEVLDQTPPPAPVDVLLDRFSDKVRLRFAPVADLESGLKAIHVYRDSKRLATLGGEKTKINSQGLWQVWNYGDEPEPRSGATVYLDTASPAIAEYYVTAENHAGRESAPSEKVMLAPETPKFRPLFASNLAGRSLPKSQQARVIGRRKTAC